MKPNKTIEQAADFKIAEEILKKHTIDWRTNNRSFHESALLAMQEYAQQFEAKLELYLRERIKQLNEADAEFCRKRWDANENSLVRGLMREQSNVATSMRQELESVLEHLGLPRFVSPPTEVQKGEESNGR